MRDTAPASLTMVSLSGMVEVGGFGNGGSGACAFGESSGRVLRGLGIRERGKVGMTWYYVGVERVRSIVAFVAKLLKRGIPVEAVARFRRGVRQLEGPTLMATSLETLFSRALSSSSQRALCQDEQLSRAAYTHSHQSAMEAVVEALLCTPSGRNAM